MEDITAWDVIKVAIPILIALIGVIYGVLKSNILENKKEIKRVDAETDHRLDKVENRLTKVETKQEK